VVSYIFTPVFVFISERQTVAGKFIPVTARKNGVFITISIHTERKQNMEELQFDVDIRVTETINAMRH
jgi:hypothetical protein